MSVTGLPRTYDIANAMREDLEEAITMISPSDTPFISYINEGEPVSNTKFEWLEDELPSIKTTIAEALDDSEVDIDVATGTGAYSRALSTSSPAVIELWRIDEEVVVVTDVSTDTWTVTRGYGDTDAAAHDDGTDILFVARIVLEGTDAIEAVTETPSRPYNYTEIFTDTAKTTGTQEAVAQVQDFGKLDRQTDKKYLELARQLERTAISGIRAVGTNSVARTTGGLLQFISSNKTAMAGAAPTEDDLLDLMQSIWDAGGAPTLILVNSVQKRRIAGWYGDRIRFTGTLRLPGGGPVVDTFTSDFGEASIMLDRWVDHAEIDIISPEYFELVPLAGRTYFEKDLAVTGDNEKKMIIGEYGFKCRAEQAHGRLTGCKRTI